MFVVGRVTLVCRMCVCICGVSLSHTPPGPAQHHVHPSRAEGLRYERHVVVGATLLGCKKGETVASEKSKLQSAIALRMKDLASPLAANQDGRDGARQSNTASSSFAQDVKQVLA